MEAEFRRRYPEFTRDNLKTLGVIERDSCFLVEESHPVIDLLRSNEEELGISIDKCPREYGKYVKVSPQVMEQCCEVLRTKVMEHCSEVLRTKVMEHCSEVLRKKVMEHSSEVLRTKVLGVREPDFDLRFELDWIKHCFKVLFAHLELDLPPYLKSDASST